MKKLEAKITIRAGDGQLLHIETIEADDWIELVTKFNMFVLTTIRKEHSVEINELIVDDDIPF